MSPKPTNNDFYKDKLWQEVFDRLNKLEGRIEKKVTGVYKKIDERDQEYDTKFTDLINAIGKVGRSVQFERGKTAGYAMVLSGIVAGIVGFFFSNIGGK